MGTGGDGAGGGSLIFSGIYIYRYIHVVRRRQLKSLVYLDGITLTVNIATVVAVRFFFFEG